MVEILSRFCGCVPLRWGAMIVGIVYLSAYTVVACLWSYNLYLFSNPGSDQDTESPRSRVIFMLLSLVLIYAIMHIVANIMLICGTIKERLVLVRSWVVFYAISLPIQNLFLLFDLIFQNKHGLLGETLFGLVLAYFLSLFFQAYFIWAVYSHYRTLQNNSRADDIEVLNFLEDKQVLSRPEYK